MSALSSRIARYGTAPLFVGSGRSPASYPQPPMETVDKSALAV